MSRGGRLRPPLITLGVTNFKAVGSAELAPTRLTVIAGANSSGKSSLLQAALFFTQSYGQPQTVINGDLVRLGEPGDVVRDGADEVGLAFSYDVAAHDEQGAPTGSSTMALRLQLAPRGDNLSPVRITLCRDGDVLMEAVEKRAPPKLPLSPQDTPLQIANAEDLSLPEDSYLSVAGLTPHRLIFRAFEAELRREFDLILEAAQEGLPFALEELTRMTRFAEREDLPVALVRRIADLRHGRGGGSALADLSDSEKEALFRAFEELQAPGGWSSEAVGVRFARTRAMRHQGRNADDLDIYLRTLGIVGAASDRMERLADAIRYLGPLREDPRVAYPLGHTVHNLPVGEKGEFTAAYLERNRQTGIRYVRPPGTRHVVAGLLPTAVSEWCRYLGIAEKVTVTPQGKLGHELGLEVDGHRRDPTAIGVGASQLLPVVVLVLGAPDDAVVCLEQPELHLHPKVQSRLGDFLAFARPQIRIIVETHSEYLITRLRLRAAEGTLDVDDLAVLFASQKQVAATEGRATAVDRFTEFTRLGLDRLGDFDAWPTDFFDTLGQDVVELAQAITRRIEDDAPPS